MTMGGPNGRQKKAVANTVKVRRRSKLEREREGCGDRERGMQRQREGDIETQRKKEKEYPQTDRQLDLPNNIKQLKPTAKLSCIFLAFFFSHFACGCTHVQKHV